MTLKVAERDLIFVLFSNVLASNTTQLQKQSATSHDMSQGTHCLIIAFC